MIKAAHDYLPAQAGGNGNYFVRIERTPGSDGLITVDSTCLEFPAGGGASAGQRIEFRTSHYYSNEGKSAEFRIYETTGETDCTDVQETNNPVFTPGKIVVNALAHPPLNLPDRIELNEGDTHNTTGLPTLAPDFDNRTKVQVSRLSGDEDITGTPTEFWIERGITISTGGPTCRLRRRPTRTWQTTKSGFTLCSPTGGSISRLTASRWSYATQRSP